MPSTEPPLTRFDVRTRDPETSHEVLRQSFLDFSIRPAGTTENFDFRQVGVATAGFSRARVRYGMGAELVTAPETGPVIVETLWNGRMTVDDGRDEVHAAFGVPVLFPTERVSRYEVDDIDVDILTLDRCVLHRTAAELFGIDPCELTFLSRTPVSPAATEYFDRSVAHVESTVLEDDEIAAAPLVMAEATRSLATAILLTFPNSGLRRTEEVARQGWAEPAVLRRALDYIDEHAGEDIGTDDIAAAAGIGVCGLQHLFRRHRDRSPAAELRRVRLDRAHTDLLAADPDGTTSVAAIAARWGFPSAEWFGLQYRPTYGCPPEATLRR